MANAFLENKISEIKGTLSKLSAGELHDLMESTRAQFDGQLTGEDRSQHVSLFRSIVDESSRRSTEPTGAMREYAVSDALKVELVGLNDEALAREIGNARAIVFSPKMVDRSSPEYRDSYQRLTALNVEQARRKVVEADRIAAALAAEKQREIVAEIESKKAAAIRSALDDSMAGL